MSTNFLLNVGIVDWLNPISYNKYKLFYKIETILYIKFIIYSNIILLDIINLNKNYEKKIKRERKYGVSCNNLYLIIFYYILFG